MKRYIKAIQVALLTAAISLGAMQVCLAQADTNAATIAYWKMNGVVNSLSENTINGLGILDLATNNGQGKLNGTAAAKGIPAAVDNLFVEGALAGVIRFSNAVPPLSMFNPGYSFNGGSSSWDAGATLTGDLAFPNDVYGDELNTPSFTAEIFFKSRAPNASRQTLLFNHHTSAYCVLEVNEDGNTGSLLFWSWNGAFFPTVRITAADNYGQRFDDGRWHYAACCFDATSLTMSLSVRNEDGTSFSRSTVLTAALRYGGSGYTYIGNDEADSHPYYGLINQVRLSGAALPDTQLLAAPHTPVTFNLASYGAFSNADQAIQTALAMAGPGDTLYFPNGTYLITNTILPRSNLHLTGQSQNGVVLQFRGQNVIMDLSGLSNVEVSCLTLDANTNLNANRGIYATSGSQLNLHHLTIKNFLGPGNVGPLAIHFNGPVNNCLLTDNYLTNIGTNSVWGGGIRCSWGASGNQILRNTIHLAGRGGIFADNGSSDLLIQSNTVSGSGLAHDAALGIELWEGCGRSIVEDNVIDHWLSLDDSSYTSVRRNTVRALDETILGFIGLELVGSSNVVFTDNLVDHGQCIGISESNDPAKNNIFWAYNTIQYMAQWGAQIQGDANGARYNYFYKNKFLNTVANHPGAPYPNDSGHAFRINNNSHAFALDSNTIQSNQGQGIQILGVNVDQFSFISNTVTGNNWTSWSYPWTAADLEWSNNTITGFSTTPVSRGFAGARPVAAFSCPVRVNPGQPVTFTNTSTAPNGGIKQLLWDFGAGLPSAMLNPTYTYARPGAYRVSLVIWDGAGRGAHVETTINVVPPSLGITLTNGMGQLSWPGWATNYSVWSTTNPADAAAWAPLTNSTVLTTGNAVVNLPVGDSARFFRLVD